MKYIAFINNTRPGAPSSTTPAGRTRTSRSSLLRSTTHIPLSCGRGGWSPDRLTDVYMAFLNVIGQLSSKDENCFIPFNLIKLI